VIENEFTGRFNHWKFNASIHCSVLDMVSINCITQMLKTL